MEAAGYSQVSTFVEEPLCVVVILRTADCSVPVYALIAVCGEHDVIWDSEGCRYLGSSSGGRALQTYLWWGTVTC